jgi:hypothetical protein
MEKRQNTLSLGLWDHLGLLGPLALLLVYLFGLYLVGENYPVGVLVTVFTPLAGIVILATSIVMLTVRVFWSHSWTKAQAYRVGALGVLVSVVPLWGSGVGAKVQRSLVDMGLKSRVETAAGMKNLQGWVTEFLNKPDEEIPWDNQNLRRLQNFRELDQERLFVGGRGGPKVRYDPYDRQSCSCGHNPWTSRSKSHAD